MKVLVTGGCGFVGSHLTDRLIDLGHEVLIVDNLSTGKIDYLNPKAIFYHSDIREVSFLKEKFDIIYHIAALARIQPSFERPQETLNVNAQGTAVICDFARKTGSKVIYAGSSSFYFDPHANPYAHSKWIGEEHCKMYNKVYGVPVAIARFFNVYGPRQTTEGKNACVIGIFERQKKNKEPLTVTGNGNKLRDFTNVFDIVDGLIKMSEKNWNGEIFNLGRSKNYSINEVAKMFQPEKIEYIPARPGEAEVTLADISFSREALGWEPTRNLPDYIAEFLKGLS